MESGRFRRGRRGQTPHGRAAGGLVVRRRGGRLRRGLARARRDVRDRKHVAPLHGAQELHGVLAERQVPRLRIEPEPELCRSRPRRVSGDRAGRPRLHRRILRGGVRIEGHRVSHHGRTGLYGPEDGTARPHAHQPSGGELHRVGTPRFPGPHQDGVPRRREGDRRRHVHRPREWPELRKRRSQLRGQRGVDRLYASRDALPGHARPDQYAGHGRAARARAEPDRGGRRAAS